MKEKKSWCGFNNESIQTGSNLFIESAFREVKSVKYFIALNINLSSQGVHSTPK